jgi:hypothetical protein
MPKKLLNSLFNLVRMRGPFRRLQIKALSNWLYFSRINLFTCYYLFGSAEHFNMLLFGISGWLLLWWWFNGKLNRLLTYLNLSIRCLFYRYSFSIRIRYILILLLILIKHVNVFVSELLVWNVLFVFITIAIRFCLDIIPVVLLYFLVSCLIHFLLSIIVIAIGSVSVWFNIVLMNFIILVLKFL